MPKLVAFLAARKGPTPETQALAAQRVEAGRLHLERARLELGKVKGELIETQEAIKVFGDLIVYFRQRLLNLPGAVKMTLGLSVGQTLGLQKGLLSHWSLLCRRQNIRVEIYQMPQNGFRFEIRLSSL